MKGAECFVNSVAAALEMHIRTQQVNDIDPGADFFYDFIRNCAVHIYSSSIQRERGLIFFSLRSTVLRNAENSGFDVLCFIKSSYLPIAIDGLL